MTGAPRPNWDQFRQLVHVRFRYKNAAEKFIRWYQRFHYACSQQGEGCHPSNAHFVKNRSLRLSVSTQNRYKNFAIEIGAMERSINGHGGKLNEYKLLVKPPRRCRRISRYGGSAKDPLDRSVNTLDEHRIHASHVLNSYPSETTTPSAAEKSSVVVENRAAADSSCSPRADNIAENAPRVTVPPRTNCVPFPKLQSLLPRRGEVHATQTWN